jgi:predicted RNA-binding protein associated with RNAse of E/G family
MVGVAGWAAATENTGGCVNLQSTARRMASGVLGKDGRMRDYRAVWLDDVFVERATWGPGEPERIGSVVVADQGHVWVRFWLPEDDAVVTRFFDADLVPVGTYVDVTMPLLRREQGYETLGLYLSLWIMPDGRVTVLDEQKFEQAVSDGSLAPGEVRWAEYHLRELTAKIARGLFPPPLVRNLRLEKQKGTTRQPAS